MSRADCRILERQALAAARDQVARNAARELSEAIRLRYLTGGAASNLQTTLLHYFFTIEHIAREVGYSEEKDSAVEEKQRVIVDTLKESLNKGGKTAQLAKRLRRSSQELDLLERRFLSAQIKEAGIMLDVEQSVVDRAISFAKLRNSRLGHATRSDVPNEEFQSWLEDAELTARSFYAAYVRHIAA
ncbi:hypothetical protein PSD17_27650 [Pseudonocardia sp. D17]|nr:hypothetical protein PSD17_27650 [Pseudonocardia sp. D17]